LTKEICIAIFLFAKQKKIEEERWVVSDWLISQDGISMPNEVKATIS
jgi:hypothetical protein